MKKERMIYLSLIVLLLGALFIVVFAMNAGATAPENDSCGEAPQTRGETAYQPLRGDVNHDGEVDASDLTVLARYVAKIIPTLDDLHTPVVDPALAPTCTQPGLSEGSHCTVCGEVIRPQRTIAALGHDFGNWTTATPATCTEDGEESRTCLDCGTVERRTVEALGHDYVNGVCSRCGRTDETRGLLYTLNDDGNSYTVSGVNALTSSDVIIPASFDGKPVTAIGNKAFADQTQVTAILIPESVTTIGTRAFYNTGITEITIPASVNSIGTQIFYKANNLKTVNYYAQYYPSGTENQLLNNASIETVTLGGKNGYIGKQVPSSVAESLGFKTNVKTVVIAEGVTSIDWEAFEDCTGLTSVTIPEGVTSIGSYAFSGCENLKTVYYEGTLGQWYGIGFGGYGSNPCWNGADLYIAGGKLTEAIIPDSVTSIGQFAFSRCTSLQSVTIPEGVTSIGEYAFYGCTGLLSVTIPDSVTSIGDYAFNSCTGLTNVTIPDSVTSIGYAVFCGCTGLTNVTIPDSVSSIGSGAFCGCTGLTSVTIPDSVTSIGESAFEGCTGLTSVTIPEGVTSIGGYAFQNCTGLTSVTIPEGVISIGYRAFASCTSLTDVTIPASVTSIGDYAFNSCMGLTNVTIPEGVTSIGSGAFCGCMSLTTVYYDGTAEQWRQISIGDYNDPLKNAEIVYICSVVNGQPVLHNFGAWTVTTPATCTEAGEETRTCAICGNIETRTVPATGHTVVTDPAEEPTCTETGLTTGSHCSVCGEILTAQTVVPATGHTYSIWTTVTAVTCTEAGEETRTCAICGNVETRTVPATGHTVVTDPAEEPTCTETGLTTGSHCSVCGEILTAQTTVPATGHTVVVDPSVFPTCTEAGHTEGSHCSVCGAIIRNPRTLAALGHDFGDWTTYTAATCTEEGVERRICSECGAVETRGIPATGHTASTDPAVAPTCTETGLTTGSHCSVCGAVLTAQTSVPATGHNYGEWTTTMEATCTEYGERYRTCNVCGDITFGKISKTPHVFDDSGVCSVCGRYGSEGLSYSLNGNAYTVDDIGSCSEKNVFIPAVYNGLPVTAIGEEAFCTRSSRYIECVTIPDSVTTIGDYAFDGCRKLATVTIGSGVTTIGQKAFNGCENLWTVYYGGTEGQWRQISIERYNDQLTNATIVCVCTTLVNGEAVEFHHDYVDGVCTRCGASEPKREEYKNLTLYFPNGRAVSSGRVAFDLYLRADDLPANCSRLINWQFAFSGAALTGEFKTFAQVETYCFYNMSTNTIGCAVDPTKGYICTDEQILSERGFRIATVEFTIPDGAGTVNVTVADVQILCFNDGIDVAAKCSFRSQLRQQQKGQLRVRMDRFDRNADLGDRQLQQQQLERLDVHQVRT